MSTSWLKSADTTSQEPEPNTAKRVYSSALRMGCAADATMPRSQALEGRALKKRWEASGKHGVVKVSQMMRKPEKY